jgi:hypothetical protein
MKHLTVLFGDLEQGVHHGLLTNGKPDREIWMYDTFAGLVEPSQFDHTVAGATLYTMSAEEVAQEWKRNATGDAIGGSSWCMCPLDNVRANITATGYPPCPPQVQCGRCTTHSCRTITT